MYCCYNCPANLYRQEPQYLITVPASYFNDEIKKGHQGHFYRTRFGSATSPDVIIQLIGVDIGNKMIHLNVLTPGGGIEFMSVHEGDLYTVTHLGSTPPQRPDTRPPWCTLYPWGPGC